MKTIALIEKGENGTFGIFTPDLKSTIIGEGKTVAEAKADFENSVHEVTKAFLEHGEKLPKEIQGLTFEYKYDIASFFDYYSFINITQFAKLAEINPSLMRQYKAGQYISKRQMAKIETTLHKVGNELSNLSLV